MLRTLSLRRLFLAAQRGSDCEVDRLKMVGEISRKSRTQVTDLRGNMAVAVAVAAAQLGIFAGPIGISCESERHTTDTEAGFRCYRPPVNELHISKKVLS